MGDIKCGTISPHCTHTHSNIHTNQTAPRHTIKYLKLITGVKYYEVKDYVHPPPKVFMQP